MEIHNTVVSNNAEYNVTSTVAMTLGTLIRFWNVSNCSGVQCSCTYGVGGDGFEPIIVQVEQDHLRLRRLQSFLCAS